MSGLSYLITISRAHVLPALMLLRTLRRKTSAEIVAVGNLTISEAEQIIAAGARYIDEREIDLTGRFPTVSWESKFREIGWYRQMMIRLSADRFITSDQVVVLDSEVFVFDNWDERRLYDEAGQPRCFCWIPSTRKPDWDYRMYRGSAYLLQHLRGCETAMEYASSTNFRRHISGVVLFSPRNLAHLWRRLETETDLSANLDKLFNASPELAFSDHDFYGIAVDYGLFANVTPTTIHENLMGWYDNHDDPVFHRFKADAMWSMCQRYSQYPTPTEYLRYMQEIAASLGAHLPRVLYWNPGDHPLIAPSDDGGPIGYFGKYRHQLDHTERARFSTMQRALDLLHQAKPMAATLVEIGTLHDHNIGGGHSTYKFSEYCSRFAGTLHSVDISAEAIRFSKRAVADFLPWVTHHVADSTEFLATFPGTIDLLYLDGLDSTPGNEFVASEKQLSEIIAALPHLSERCVVLLDDADLPHQGKTRLSAPYLTANGFALLDAGYQLLFGRGFKVAM